MSSPDRRPPDSGPATAPLDRSGLDPRVAEALAPSAEARLLRHLIQNGRPEVERQIFVNRALRMDSIRHVGFDLDWTLADYERLPLERLTFELTLERLIEHHGYDPTIRRAEFRPDFPRRGLLIDKEAGTVLRMSRHRFVNLAYFGRSRLDRNELKRLYRFEPIHPASDRFYHIDSLFELPEANLYSELIELGRESGGRPFPSRRRVFEDVRAAIDWVHASGSLKRRVLADAGSFLHRDELLGLALARLALGGRRRFLLTNSDWDYANGLCSFLFDGLLPGLDSWRSLFDLVVVNAGKPTFFQQERPFRELDAEGRETGERRCPRWGGVYSGGCLQGLMELIGEPGEHVLYVGDHIYGDIVRSKLESTWRTALIVRELEEEIRRSASLSDEIRKELELKSRLGRLGHDMDHLRDLVAVYEKLREEGAELPSEPLRQARRAFEQISREHLAVLRRRGAGSERLANGFNPYWGSFFKQGTSKTRFASQIEAYACLYTSRVANFAYYGSSHYFRVTRDPMMHEL